MKETIMKVSIALTALAIGLSSIGVAQAAGHNAYYPSLQQSQNAESRAQVVQELQQAESKGQISEGHDPYYPMVTAASTKSRAQVVSELKKANGHLANVGRDAYYPTRPAV
ncbi:DUF4148 domain-containing protein [Castellaniella sp.]|uniref:DUF4148 domain-containing protein n=1 Tax=Castellaniella sp. TaxID=1955812 RepID=UPI0025C172BF|nr:DUF4148 domain-containing protein [Castellaniella sp.]